MFESNKSALSVAIAGTLGVGGLLISSGAAAIPAGNYIIAIQTTPVTTTYYGATSFKIGRDGAWNSSFSFGIATPGPTSQGMTDNDTTVLGSDGNSRGSGVAGDGYAGKLTISVDSSGNFTVSTFNVDTIFGTAGGNFAQHVSSPTMPAGNTSAMSGTITSANAMTFRPTGRRGSISAPNTLFDRQWLVDDAICDGGGCTSNGNTVWQQFTTGTASNPLGSISGSPVAAVTDINGDGTNDYQAILVSGGTIGSDWGGFFGATYFETWKAYLLTATTARDDTATIADGGSQVIDVLANDWGVGRSITAVTQGTLGTVTNNGTNVTYNSTGGPGIDSFTYTIASSDDSIVSTATVEIIICSAPNPCAVGDTGTTNQGQSVVIDVTTNDVDIDGTIDVATVAPVSPTANGGTAVSNNDGTVTYTPASGFVGEDTFTYTVDDNAGNPSSVATVTVTVNAAAQTDSGTYAPGSVAIAAGSTTGVISASDLPVEDDGVERSCVGGCFDFVITGAANPTSVVLLPLSEAIQEGYIYRKLISGTWQDFDTATTGDSIASAPLSAGGGCPAPADGSWVTWSGAAASANHAGHECLRLTIADAGAGDGPNDSNSAAGTIADPGGLAIPAGDTSTDSPVLDSFASNTGGGCTLGSGPGATQRLDLWLLAGLLALFGLRGRFQRH